MFEDLGSLHLDVQGCIVMFAICSGSFCNMAICVLFWLIIDFAESANMHCVNEFRTVWQGHLWTKGVENSLTKTCEQNDSRTV